MKRPAALVLLLAAIICLSGCLTSKSDGSPTFYYLHKEPTYTESIIGSEPRLSVEADSDLGYLLALYLSGPISNDLYSPFPKGAAIDSLDRNGETLEITMNSVFGKMTGITLTKACACLALTVFENSEVQVVFIHAVDPESGSAKDIQLTRDSFLLYDDLTPDP